jgi:hypothetical protein
MRHYFLKHNGLVVLTVTALAAGCVTVGLPRDALKATAEVRYEDVQMSGGYQMLAHCWQTRAERQTIDFAMPPNYMCLANSAMPR